MTFHRLERPEQASAALDRARELMTQSKWQEREDCRDLLREAELLVEGRAQSAPQRPSSADDEAQGDVTQ